MKKHYFFDMDMTLTESTQKISESMTNAILGLTKKGGDVIVVSGARKEKIIEQIGKAFEEMGMLAQNGNHAELASGVPVWKRELDWVQKKVTLNVIQAILDKNPGACQTNILDLVQDRGCQISYSMIGHTAPLEKKKEFDERGDIRKGVMLSSAVVDLLKPVKVKWAIGGTTCIDFYERSKGDNVAEFIEYHGWNKEECVYVGDALFKGGNDESVIGIIDTVQVKGPHETECIIRDATKLMREDKEVEEDNDDEDDDDDL